MKKHRILFLLLVAVVSCFAQSPCENGLVADQYPCNQITMLAHMAPDELLAIEHRTYFLNDIWGWTDTTTGKEYGLIGLKDGVSFVDVSNPTNPILLGKLPEPSSSRSARIMHGKSTWRDIKVYQSHAFIVSDLNDDHGMQVFDLAKLRGLDGTDVKTFAQDFHYTEVGSSHNVVINEETGFAYIVGISSGKEPCEGGLHIVDIRNPKNPTFVNCFSADGYTHDAQCVVYQGSDSRYVGKELCFNSNEDTFTIVNVENKQDPQMIGRETYDRVRYSHQGWLTEDHHYFLMNDELDELSAGGKHPRTLIWELKDLEKPELIGEYYNVAEGIDHNLYTHDNKVFESNYQTGLRVLDTERIAQGQLREIAYFDTYPQGNAIDFGGTWSNYPYFESGTILVSDMVNGLFLLKLDLEEDPITVHPENQTQCADGGVRFVTNADGANLNYQWEVFDGLSFSELTDDSPSFGASDTVLTVPTIASEADFFRCKITNEQGSVFYTYPASFSENLRDGNIPTASFTYALNPTTGAMDFTNESTDATEYIWDFGDGSTSSEANPSHLFGSQEDQEVELIALNNCAFARKKSKVFFEVLGLSTEELIQVYPNPASEYLTVESPIAINLQLIDLSGKIKNQWSLIEGTHDISLKNQEAGIYIVRFIDKLTNDLTDSQRIMIK